MESLDETTPYWCVSTISNARFECDEQTAVQILSCMKDGGMFRFTDAFGMPVRINLKYVDAVWQVTPEGRVAAQQLRYRERIAAKRAVEDIKSFDDPELTSDDD